MATGNRHSQKYLRAIFGIGSGAIAGTLMGVVCVAVTEKNWIVFFGMFLGAILGSVIPESGIYAVTGGILGIVFAHIFGSDDAERWWSILIPTGVFLGFIHRIILTNKQRTVSSKSNSNDEKKSDLEEKNIDGVKERIYRTEIGKLSFYLGPIVGASIGFLMCGPGFITAFFFYACIAIGALVGASLFFGFAVSAFFSIKTQKYDTPKNEDSK